MGLRADEMIWKDQLEFIGLSCDWFQGCSCCLDNQVGLFRTERIADDLWVTRSTLSEIVCNCAYVSNDGELRQRDQAVVRNILCDYVFLQRIAWYFIDKL